MIESPRKRLVEVLGGIAMYNDKGYQWSGDSAEQIAEERSKAQAEIERLLTAIGTENGPSDLLDALKSGHASQEHPTLTSHPPSAEPLKASAASLLRASAPASS
jgi:hypothetical protein